MRIAPIAVGTMLLAGVSAVPVSAHPATVSCSGVEAPPYRGATSSVSITGNTATVTWSDGYVRYLTLPPDCPTPPTPVVPVPTPPDIVTTPVPVPVPPETTPPTTSKPKPKPPVSKPRITCATLKRAGAGRKWIIRYGCFKPRVLPPSRIPVTG